MFMPRYILSMVMLIGISMIGSDVLAQIEDNTQSRWRQPSPQDASAVMKKKPKKAPARVRIGLRLTPRALHVRREGGHHFVVHPSHAIPGS